MHVSLERFLRTGQFGDLKPGMSAEEVRRLLGEPDAVGGTSRKYRRPSIWLYGPVEIYFRQSSPYDMTALFWDAGEKGPLRLPSHCVVEDWDLQPGMARTELEAWLQAHGLVAIVHALGQETSITLVLSSGVRITLDDNDRLYSIYSDAPLQ